MQALFDYFNSVSPLSEPSRKALSHIIKSIHIRKNEHLQGIGHTCKTIYFLKKGLARIYYYKDAIEITESFALENSIVLRYESLFTGRPSRKAIQVLEDSDFIAIPAIELFGLYNTHHDIERLFRRIFESALVEQVNRIESIQFHSAEERYTELMRDSPDLIRRVALKHIASYLGITPVSLSRIRALK